MTRRLAPRALLLASALGALASCSATAPTGARLAADRFVAPRAVFEVRWRRHLTEEPLIEYKPQEFAAAAVWQDRVFIGSSAGELLALDRRSGDIHWHARLGGAIASRPRVVEAEGALYVGGQDGGLYAFDLRTGAQRWVYFAKAPIESQPAWADGLLFFTTGDSRVYALETGRGAWKWQYEREPPESFTVRGYGGPTIVQDRVYVGFSDGHLGCLKAGTGEVVWMRSLAGESTRLVDVDSTPLYDRGTLYVSAQSTGVYALDPKDGSTRWHFPIDGAGTVRVGQGGVYFAAARKGLFALDHEGRLRWNQSLSEAGELSAPTLFGPYVLLSASNAGVYIAEAERGVLQQFLLPGHGATGEPVADADQAYVLSNGGYFYALGLQRPR